MDESPDHEETGAPKTGGGPRGADSPGALVRAAAVALLAIALVTGVAYPLSVTAVARLVFPHRAAGSLVWADGRLVGSDLIGQPFTDPGYFWGRPSVTTGHPYDAAHSSGSNLSPRNPRLLQDVELRVDALRAADPANPAPVPVDLVTSSGSGLDPHISPAAAYWQVPRVARARGLGEAAVRALVDEYTSGRQLGILGQPRVNVLRLNLALDALDAGG